MCYGEETPPFGFVFLLFSRGGRYTSFKPSFALKPNMLNPNPQTARDVTPWGLEHNKTVMTVKRQS